MRKPRFVVEVDKATLDYINELRDRHNDAHPGAGWRQKDTVRYLTETHRVTIGKIEAAFDAEMAAGR